MTMLHKHSQIWLLYMTGYLTLVSWRVTLVEEELWNSWSSPRSNFDVVHVVQSLVFYVVCCLSVVLSAIVLSVLRFLASAYPFGIYKLFLYTNRTVHRYTNHNIYVYSEEMIDIDMFGSKIYPGKTETGIQNF